MLVINSSRGTNARCRFIGGSIANLCLSEGNTAASRFGGLNNKTSIPDGLQSGKAIFLALSDGGMVTRILNSFGTINLAGAGALGNITFNVAGTGGVLYSNLAGGINIYSSAVNGAGTIGSLTPYGKAKISADISIGSRPTAQDIASAVWEELIAGHTSPGTTGESIKKTLKRDEFLGLS